MCKSKKLQSQLIYVLEGVSKKAWIFFYFPRISLSVQIKKNYNDYVLEGVWRKALFYFPRISLLVQGK